MVNTAICSLRAGLRAILAEIIMYNLANSESIFDSGLLIIQSVDGYRIDF